MPNRECDVEFERSERCLKVRKVLVIVDTAIADEGDWKHSIRVLGREKIEHQGLIGNAGKSDGVVSRVEC